MLSILRLFSALTLRRAFSSLFHLLRCLRWWCFISSPRFSCCTLCCADAIAAALRHDISFRVYAAFFCRWWFSAAAVDVYYLRLLMPLLFIMLIDDVITILICRHFFILLLLIDYACLFISFHFLLSFSHITLIFITLDADADIYCHYILFIFTLLFTISFFIRLIISLMMPPFYDYLLMLIFFGLRHAFSFFSRHLPFTLPPFIYLFIIYFWYIYWWRLRWCFIFTPLSFFFDWCAIFHIYFHYAVY